MGAACLLGRGPQEALNGRKSERKDALTSTVGSWGAVMLGTPENTLENDHNGEAGVF